MHNRWVFEILAVFISLLWCIAVQMSLKNEKIQTTDCLSSVLCHTVADQVESQGYCSDSAADYDPFKTNVIVSWTEWKRADYMTLSVSYITMTSYVCLS